MNLLYYGSSYHPEINKNSNQKYIKMQGRKVYEFALTNVPNSYERLL